MLDVGVLGQRAGIGLSARNPAEVEMSPTDRVSVWPITSLVHRVTGQVRAFLPEGRPIPESVWAQRHRGIVRLVWLHAVGLLIATVLINPGHVEGYIGGL